MGIFSGNKIKRREWGVTVVATEKECGSGNSVASINVSKQGKKDPMGVKNI